MGKQCDSIRISWIQTVSQAQQELVEELRKAPLMEPRGQVGEPWGELTPQG